MTRERRVRELVEFLCSAECNGRQPGSPGSAAARARIVQEFEAAGLTPAGTEGWLQPVPGCGHNILGALPGQGVHAERVVIVAAHYDHLGPAHGGQAYWGADDNAAAVAILVEVAREIARDGLGRTVLVAAFDGEEPPHFQTQTMGSMHYVREPVLPLERTDMMICMDLVGHAIGPASFPQEVRDSLFVLGAELSEGTGALVDAVAAESRGVVPRRLGLDVIPPLSDYYAFDRAGVPVLFLTCGRWEHYHQVSDTPEKLDYPKVVATSGFLCRLVEALSRREGAAVARPEGRDDAASLRSLLAMGRPLSGHVHQVAPVLPLVEALLAAAEADRLPPDGPDTIRMLVMQLESILA